MKFFTHVIVGLFLVFSLDASAQFCGFDQRHNTLLKNEAFARQMIENEEQIQRLIASGNIGTRLDSDPPYTIPVVFHVIHSGGEIGSNYNPTDAQLQALLQYTNQVYAGTAQGMAGGVGNMQVQFALAKRDPNCNPTSGIVRVNGSAVSGYTANGVRFNSDNGATELSIKNLSRWNTSAYYNIWIVNKFDGVDGFCDEGVVGGFAYIPGAPSNLDGTMMLASFAVEGNTVLAHELGHAFNLYHPFEGSSNASQCPNNANCTSQGDRVCDTDPISNNVTGGVTSFACRTGINPCTGTPYGINTEHNIMSYTDCPNLFTAGQKVRVLAAAAAGRLSLTTSMGATAPNLSPVCPPKINFAVVMSSVSEASAGVMDCRRYSDYTYKMVIGNGATQPAMVTLSINGGTATNNFDYILSTNNDFVTPSNILSFPAGSIDSQSFKIRVFDDGYIEPSETIVLGFEVAANGGNALKGEAITNMTVTITDNDTEPIYELIKTDVVGTLCYLMGTSTAGSNPLNAKLEQKKNTWILRASELTARGFRAGLITNIALYVQKNSTRPYTNFQIKMGATSRNYLVDGGAFGVTTSTVASIPSFTTVNEWNTITLDVPFNWNGISNVCIELCYQNAAADPNQLSDVTFGYFDGGTTNQGSMYWSNTINCTTPYSGISYYQNGLKPTTGLVMKIAPNRTASTVNATTTGYLGPFGEMYFYTASNQILAKIKNLTNWDYGCTQVTIDRAGNGTKPFINNNAANAISDKTIVVIPTNNNPAGQYEITLFYTPSEVNGYKTGTSTLWAQAALVKTTNAISSYPAGSVPVESAMMGSNFEQGFFGPDSTIKATFTGSFSGFGVIPSATVLPVSWLTFYGKMDRGNAQLDWATASEQNNSHFEVETSRDANAFVSLGQVKGAGNSTQVSQYNFTHIKPLSGINYYRIRQVDKDGKSSLSQVIGLRAENSGKAPSLYPNPASDRVMVDWGSLAGQAGRWELLSPDMKALRNGQSAFTSSVQGISIGDLPAGVYYLKLMSGKEVKMLRFIKQ